MKTIIAIGSGLVALALAGGLGMPRPAFADETTTMVNDNAIKAQQMDFYLRNGGYMLQQNTYAASVGVRNSTVVTPFNWFPMPVLVQPMPVAAAPILVAPVVAAPVAVTPVIVAPIMAAPVIAAPIMAAPVMAAPLVAAPVMTGPSIPPRYTTPPSMAVPFVTPPGLNLMGH